MLRQVGHSSKFSLVLLPGQLGVLITASGIYVEVQTKLAGLGARTGRKRDRGLQAAEPGSWRPDLDTALHPFKLNESEHLAPEGRQPGRIRQSITSSLILHAMGPPHGRPTGQAKPEE